MRLATSAKELARMTDIHVLIDKSVSAWWPSHADAGCSDCSCG